MKRGLILEGGAMRGLFTAGVMDVLMEAGVVFDGAVGVSAGACFGCNYKSGQIGRVLRYNTRFCADKRYGGLGVLLKTGNIFSTEFCYGEVPLRHDPFDFEAYEANPMEFFVVCTDVESGEAVYHKYESYADHGFDWIRASASMPLVSRMVEIAGKKYLDGGIADSIPLARAFEQGYEHAVVVLTRQRGYRKEEKPPHIPPFIYSRYPKLREALRTRGARYNAQLTWVEQLEDEGRITVIRPDHPVEVTRIETNMDKMNALYRHGFEMAEKILD